MIQILFMLIIPSDTQWLIYCPCSLHMLIAHSFVRSFIHSFSCSLSLFVCFRRLQAWPPLLWRAPAWPRVWPTGSSPRAATQLAVPSTTCYSYCSGSLPSAWSRPPPTWEMVSLTSKMVLFSCCKLQLFCMCE